jgi:histidinol-phosphate aminotransferase
MDIKALVRENIKKLKPYSSAREEFSGEAKIFLDANENSLGSPLPRNYNRYPDPMQSAIKARIAAKYGINVSEIFVGNGSDEAIDLAFRIFCEPGIDSAIICPPTYGMYEVSAQINNVNLRKVPLKEDFSLDFEALKLAFEENSKLLFICSPNNPTGNSFPAEQIIELIASFPGIVVLDEAYVHFSSQRSLVQQIKNFPNLIVLQTFSKAWGLAGLRVGLAFSNEEIIGLYNKVKPPYNLSEVVQELMLKALDNEDKVEAMVKEILTERIILASELQKFSFVKKIFPSDANFLLVRFEDADLTYKFLIEEKIVVRNRSRIELCQGCLRITVGTSQENQELLQALQRFQMMYEKKSLVY